jgi:hypothetical protein
MTALAIMFRFSQIHLSPSASPKDKETKMSLLKSLGNFLPKWTERQKHLIKDYIRQLQGLNPPSHNANLQFIHSFFIDLFTHSYSPLEKVASVMEQAVLFKCLASNGQWKSAKHTVTYCDAVIRTARCMVINASFMGSLKKDYKSIKEMEDTNHDEDSDDEDEDVIVFEEEIDLTLNEDLNISPSSALHSSLSQNTTLDPVYS